MKNKTATIILIVFAVLAAISFTFGTVLSVPMLADGIEGIREQGSTLAVILFVAPFLLSYLLFALLDVVTIFLSIRAIRKNSAALGIVVLLLGTAMLIAAIVISVLLFAAV